MVFSALTLKAKLIGLAGIVLVLVGIFYSGHTIGYTKGAAKSKVEIAKYKQKIANLESQILEKQTETNTKVITKYHDRVKIVEKNVYANQEIARKNPVTNHVSNSFVELHDSSASGENADATRAVDGKASSFTETEALLTIINNYGQCRITESRLIALQEWILETKKNIEEAK